MSDTEATAAFSCPRCGETYTVKFLSETDDGRLNIYVHPRSNAPVHRCAR